jgi:hypothetical protein
MYNELTTLDVSKNPLLSWFNCQYNRIASPDDVIGWRDIAALEINSPEDEYSGSFLYHNQKFTPKVPMFYDKYGNELIALTEETLVTSLAYTNSSNDTERRTMYVAVYKPDGRLAYIGQEALEIEVGQTVYFKVSINMPDNQDGRFATAGYYAYVFLWDSDTYAPVTEKYEF